MNRRMGEEVAVYRVNSHVPDVTYPISFLFLTIIRGKGPCVNFICKVIDPNKFTELVVGESGVETRLWDPDLSAVFFTRREKIRLLSSCLYHSRAPFYKYTWLFLQHPP